MERQQFYPGEEPDGEDGTGKSKKKKAPGVFSDAQGFGNAASDESRPGSYGRHVAVVPSLEGVISWRDVVEAPGQEETDETQSEQLPAQEFAEDRDLNSEPNAAEAGSVGRIESQEAGASLDGAETSNFQTEDYSRVPESENDPLHASQQTKQFGPSSNIPPSRWAAPNSLPFVDNYNRQPDISVPPLYNQAPTVVSPNVTPNIPQSAPNIQPASMPANQPPRTPSHSPYYNPAVNPSLYNMAPGAPSPTQHESTAPIMPIEHPLPSPARDPRVGGVAALLGLEYFARRRADRKLEERVTKRADERFKEQRQQFTAEQERQRRQLDSIHSHEPTPQTAPEALRHTPDLPKPFEASQPAYGAPERANQQPYSPNSAPEQQVAKHQVEVGQTVPEQYEQPGTHLGPHEHVQHSAWHNIVVDEKGHEVAGAIQYGEGFKRERQQEAIHQRAHVNVGGQYNSMGTGSGMSHDQFGTPMLPSGMTNPALSQGQDAPVDPQHQLPANSQRQPNFANPWFWIMLILIILAFFTATLV